MLTPHGGHASSCVPPEASPNTSHKLSDATPQSVSTGQRGRTAVQVNLAPTMSKSTVCSSKQSLRVMLCLSLGILQARILEWVAFLQGIISNTGIKPRPPTLQADSLPVEPHREGNGKPLQYSCLENPMNSMKRQEDRTLKDELPRSVGAQYAPGDQWRNNSRKNKGMEPKQNNTKCGCDW